MKSMTVFGLVVLFGLALGCGQQAAPPPADTAVDEAVQAPTAVEPVTLEIVEVAPEGTKFDPPVEVAQIPVGAWYCDMGTVHYARMDQGDGKCPICGMNLVQKVAPEPTDEGMAQEAEPTEGGEH